MVDLPANTKQTITFQRYARKDKVTGAVTYGKWNATSGTIPEFTAPSVAGYYASPAKLDAVTVNVDPQTPDMNEKITYHKIREISNNPDIWINENGEKVKVNKTYRLASNEGDSAIATKDFVVAHSTATPDAPALNIARNMKNSVNNNGAYVHLVVDDQDCYLVGDLGYVAWGCGYAGNHRAPVQIELCEFPSDHTRALQAYRNYISLIRQYATMYNIPLELDTTASRGVKTHLWITNNVGGTDHTDPYDYLASIGVTKAQFASDVAGSTGNSDGSGTGSDSGNNTMLPIQANGIPQGFTKESGTFRCGGTPIRNREWAPSLSNKSTGQLGAYQYQKYDSYAKVGKYTWIHYTVIGKNNFHHEYYLPVREWHADGTSTAWGTFQ